MLQHGGGDDGGGDRWSDVTEKGIDWGVDPTVTIGGMMKIGEDKMKIVIIICGSRGIMTYPD